MTFSFFLPPANAVSGRATMSAASTSRAERVTVLDATFAEEQLRSGNFIGTRDLPLDSLVAFLSVTVSLLSYGPFLYLVLFLRYLPCPACSFPYSTSLLSLPCI